MRWAALLLALSAPLGGDAFQPPRLPQLQRPCTAGALRFAAPAEVMQTLGKLEAVTITPPPQTSRILPHAPTTRPPTTARSLDLSWRRRPA